MAKKQVDALRSNRSELTTRVGSNPTPATTPKKAFFTAHKHWGPGNPNLRLRGWGPPTKATPHDLRTLDSIPDGTLAPSQVTATPEDHRWENEKKLMYAVIEESIQDFQRYAYVEEKEAKDLFEKAQAWIGEKDDPEESGNYNLYTFEWLCLTLDINPENIRRGLATWLANTTKPKPTLLGHNNYKKGGNRHRTGGQVYRKDHTKTTGGMLYGNRK